MTFFPGLYHHDSQDLREIQLRAGGQPGFLDFERHPVLRVEPHIFLTHKEPPKRLKQRVEAAGGDLHHIKGYADTHAFLQSYKRYRRAYGEAPQP